MAVILCKLQTSNNEYKHINILVIKMRSIIFYFILTTYVFISKTSNQNTY